MAESAAPPPPRYVKPDRVFCSFCLKPQEEVRQMVAGPANIFICAGCVNLCVESMAGRSPDRSAYVPPDKLPTERLLAQLKPVDESLRGKFDQLRWLVATLRAREVGWSAIGEALGLTPQAARERFSSSKE